MGGHHERPRPGRFSRMVVAYPVAVMMASGGIAIVLAMLAFTAGESELGGSFTDTEDPIVRKLYGFLAMRHDKVCHIQRKTGNLIHQFVRALFQFNDLLRVSWKLKIWPIDGQ